MQLASRWKQPAYQPPHAFRLPAGAPGPARRCRFTPAEKKMLKGTNDFFSMNFYTAYFVSAPVNPIDPTMVRTGNRRARAPGATWVGSDPRSRHRPGTLREAARPVVLEGMQSLFNLPTGCGTLPAPLPPPAVLACRCITTAAATPSRALVASLRAPRRPPPGCTRRRMPSARPSSGSPPGGRRATAREGEDCLGAWIRHL